MIIEKLQTARTLLEARQQSRSEKNQLDSLDVFKEDLETLKAQWDRVVATEPFLEMDRSLVRRVVEQLTILTKRVSTSVSRSDLAPLRNTIDELERDATARWNIRKHQWMDSGLVNRARILAVIGTPEVRSRIDGYVHAIDGALQQESMPSMRELTMLEQIQRRLTDEISANLPPMVPAVEQFLSQLADGTARLELVTPEILSWCRQQGLTRRIMLSMSGG